VLLSAFAAYRHYTLDVPFGLEAPDEIKEKSAADTTHLEKPAQQ
jgi:hypothetical protein